MPVLLYTVRVSLVNDPQPAAALAQGYQEFTEAIRRAFNLPQDAELNVSKLHGTWMPSCVGSLSTGLVCMMHLGLGAALACARETHLQ